MCGVNSEKSNNMASSYADAAKSKPRETDEIEGIKPVFVLESDLFGEVAPSDYKHFYIYPTEMYKAVGEQISVRSLTGLQRVRGLWRVYLDNDEDRKTLLSKGVVIRKKSLTLYTRNPRVVARESQASIRVRIKDVPLSADDGQIIRALELNGCDVIKHYRERLRVDNFLTNCQTGDRVVICKPFDTPLPRSLFIGKYKATIIHRGQSRPWEANITCNKCLETGHKANQCNAEWKCKNCGEEGHKQDICPKNVFSDMSDGVAESESELESDFETDDNKLVGSNDDTQTKEHDETQDSQDTPQTEDQIIPDTQPESQQSQSILGKQTILASDKTDEIDKSAEVKTPKRRKKVKRQNKETRQEQITKYIPGQVTGNLSEDSKTPRAHKLTDCFEKSPVTPPEVLHDKESSKGNKKAKK